MGYRSDLEAAQARAAALEQKLASGEEEKEALRQELDDLKKPKKPKKVKEPKKVKKPRKKRNWSKILTPMVIMTIACLLIFVGLGVWSYLYIAGTIEDREARDRKDAALVQSFVDAWAAERYEDAWALTDEDYRAGVSKGRFAREMKHHPFIRDVRGATLKNERSGVLHTSDGDLSYWSRAYRGVFSGISVDGFELLPPSAPALVTGHAFLRALLDKNFEESWKNTHPIYRKSMDATRFAEGLAPNIWLTASTGFRLKSGDKDTSSNELHGFLITKDGNVGVVLSYTEGDNTPWISEMTIGGKPSLPSP
jgi:hypothetical protein